MNERRYDIDWLRVIVMLAVFFFHCASFFGGLKWHLNNNEKSIVAFVFIGWLDTWFMPFFFLLSGAGSWYALRYRDNVKYFLERTKRILVPLYTVGLFLLLPPQFYFEIYSNEGYRGTFWNSLHYYFNDMANFSFSWPGDLVHVPFSAHLWFLQFLFIASLLALPLFRFLRSEKGLYLIDKLADWCKHRSGIFIFLIPVLLMRIGLRSFFHGGYTWADFLEFILFFILGYIFTANDGFTESIKKNGWLCLAIGMICFAAEGFFIFKLGYNYPGSEPFSFNFVLFETVMSIGRWSWILFVLSLGAKYLNFNKRGLNYCNEAVLPFYILHQTVILCIGWFAIRWDIGILPKYFIISAASFVLIILIYELLISRFNVVRFFFGMRAKRSTPARSIAHQEEAVA